MQQITPSTVWCEVMPPDAVGQLVQELRQKAGLLQLDLARRLHKPQSFVSKLENGSRALKVAELQQLCKALEITPEEFVAMLFE